MSTCWVTFDNMKFDFRPAEKFGEIRYFFPSSMDRDYSTLRAVDYARTVAEGMDEEDYLIMAGDPTLYAIAITAVVERFGKCNVLRWDGRAKNYVPVVIDFSD